MTQDPSSPRGLNAWLARIRDQELPIFGRTAERIRDLTDSEKAAVSELAEAILCDPGMTAKLLRIANSVIFNTAGWQITTVSRAVVMLGFDMVRQIALSVAFVDAFLRGPVRERVLREMARAFRVPRVRGFFTVILPATSPQILAGVKIGLSISFIVVIISEMFGSTEGIGHFVIASQRQFDIAGVWVGTLVIACIGYLLNTAFTMIQRRILAWHPSARSLS